MRIACSGSHRVGKSTLVERLADALPHYVVVEEPYHLLADDGYESADPPSAEDFEAQLARSIREVARAGADVLFDRCPADVLAYLLVEGADVEPWLDRARAAMQRLDLVVLVPIETPDRVVLSAHEDGAQRRAVDVEVAQLLIDEELAEDVITVHGDPASRAAQVLAAITERG